VFVMVACILQVLFAINSQDKQVFSKSFTYDKSELARAAQTPSPTPPPFPAASGSPSPVTSAPSPENSRYKVTDYFDLTGRTCNLTFKTTADVENRYLYNNYTLIDEKTQKAFDFGREVEYYHGRDSDGPWTEGSRTDEVTVASIPAGRYFMLIEPQSDQQVVNYSVAIRRDVCELWPFIVLILLILIPPAILKYRQWSFEVERWKESDHPLVASGEGSSDDD